jgi:hypothetical protein
MITGSAPVVKLLGLEEVKAYARLKGRKGTTTPGALSFGGGS